MSASANAGAAGEATTAAILDAAAELFSARGYSAVSRTRHR